MQITIEIGEKQAKILKKRAEKNLMTIREQAEDIIRRSCVNYKQQPAEDNCDDSLVQVFSRKKKAKK